MATGTVLLALGFLRALQVEFGGVGRLPSSMVYGSSGHFQVTGRGCPT